MPPSDPVVVRRALPEDAAVLAHLRWAFKKEDHESGGPEICTIDEVERWIGGKLRGGSWVAWVVEADGLVVGHVFLNLVERVPEPFEHNRPIGYVTNFYVAPQHRNRGMGSALLDALREHARAEHIDVLIVWPSDRSVPLYQRAGFQRSEEVLEAR